MKPHAILRSIEGAIDVSEQIQEVPTEEVFLRLETRPDGLRNDEVAERRRVVGENTLEIDHTFDWPRRLLYQFMQFFTLLLLLSAAICFVADHLQPGEGMNVLGWALIAVACLNALFSFIQEYRAERAMEELRKFLPNSVTVMRDGTFASVDAAELVPGDIIEVREGDRIPADARLIETAGLLVNNAPLTGESLSIDLSPDATDAGFVDARNLIFAGCIVVRGHGRAVVFATGFRSQFGRIAELSRKLTRTSSPLEHETRHMVRILTLIAVTMGVVFFIYGLLADRSLWVNLVFMMGIIVANVPEGLLPTFTLSLAMGSLRMAKRQVLVKSLNAVETLGALHVICTDKTGTLTKNTLSVTEVVGPDGLDLPDDQAEALLTRAIAACDLSFEAHDPTGDPLDVAIAKRLVQNADVDVPALSKNVSQYFPFDLQLRRSAGIVADVNSDGYFVVKGAWEALRSMLGLDGGALAQIDETVQELAASGRRVIAVAGRDLAAEEDAATGRDALECGLKLYGFICLEDPLRDEVPDAVSRCHDAGIGVVMITGDHPQTAVAIAKRAGIVAIDSDPTEITLTGLELAEMSENEIVQALRNGIIVFARTTPEQKMKIVIAFQQMNKVVGVTGDGVNDAPALKAADVGIAMVQSGTDVAREAAQVVLLDDNFASIVNGVEEGRTIHANIRKFTNYVLVSNGPEIIPYIAFMLFPVPLALNVIQILSIDLGSDIVPSIALGQERPTPEIMKEPPRSVGKGLLTRSVILHSYGFLGLIEAAVSMGLFFWVLAEGGWTWGSEIGADDPLYRSATGIALASILLMQIGNLIGRRSRFKSGLDRGLVENRLMLMGIALQIVFSWAVLYAPPVSAVLGTGPVPLYIYATAWSGVPLIFGLDYARKLVARSWFANQQS